METAAVYLPSSCLQGLQKILENSLLRRKCNYQYQKLTKKKLLSVHGADLAS